MIEVLMYIMMPASTLLVVLYLLMKERQRRDLLKRQDVCAKRITNIKESFRTTLELFSMQRIIRPQHVKAMCNIVDNYFVDQPINEKNTRELETLANSISMTIAREVNMTKSDADTEWVKRKLLNFSLMLPQQPQDYNRLFYRSRMKLLLKGLNTTRAKYVQTRHQHLAAA